jgi:hypothetical protein
VPVRGVRVAEKDRSVGGASPCEPGKLELEAAPRARREAGGETDGVTGWNRVWGAVLREYWNSTVTRALIRIYAHLNKVGEEMGFRARSLGTILAVGC